MRTLRPRWAGSTPWGHAVSEQRRPSRWPVGTWASHTAGQAELGTPPFSATAHTRVAGDTARDPSELKTDRSSSPAPQDRAEAGTGRAGRRARGAGRALTPPSCACGTSVARGCATSSSWPATGLAGRRPASPLSGPASRTGRAPWSSNRSTPRRSRRCWLGGGTRLLRGALRAAPPLPAPQSVRWPGRVLLPRLLAGRVHIPSPPSARTPHDRKRRPRGGADLPEATRCGLGLRVGPHILSAHPQN